MKPPAARVTASLIVLLLLGSAAHAGSAPASLSCAGKTSTGALTIKGLIPATEESLDLRVTYGGAVAHFKNDGASAKVIEDFSKKVFVLILTDHQTGSDTEMYAIPDTVRSKGALQASFSAYVTLPRPGLQRAPAAYDDFLHKARVQCSYRYEI